MYQSPSTHKPVEQRLSDLRMEQYAALETHPIDWEAVGRIGQQILALEIHRQRAVSPRARQVLADAGAVG